MHIKESVLSLNLLYPSVGASHLLGEPAKNRKEEENKRGKDWKKKMNGYSKIKIIGSATHSPRSNMDRSDLLSSSSSSSFPHPKTHSQNPETIHKSPTRPEEYSASSEKELGSSFEGLNLSRTTSLSSASVALQSAVKRAFSIKRSSSVSESYCRIHDQSVTLASPADDVYYEDHGAPGNNNQRSVKKMNSRTKILKACKKLLRL